MKPLEPYRYQNGERWEGSTWTPVARSRARRALADADPGWDRRPSAERRRLIGRYVAEESS